MSVRDNASFPSKSKKSHLAFLTEIIGSSAIILLVGFVESIVGAKKYATKHGYEVSANRELVEN